MTALTKVVMIGLLGCVLALLAQLDLLNNKSIKHSRATEIPEPFACPPVDEAAALDRFRGLIAFPSVSNASREDHVNDPKVFRSMMSYLEQSYPRVWEHLQVEAVGVNGLSLLITWPGSRPELAPVLFVSHYDVVPVTPDSEDKWTHPPFSGALADGYVWGRGAADIKFSVAALLQAASTLLEGATGLGPFRPERTVMFAFGHDEELGGTHGAGATAALLRSRGVALDVVVDEGGVLLLDGLRPFATRQPVAMVGLAEKGYAQVEVVLHSQGGHSSMPPIDGSDVGSQIWRLGTALRLLPTPTKLGPPVTEMLSYAAPYAPAWMRQLLARVRSGPLNWLAGQLLRLAGRETASMVATSLALTRLAGGVANNVLPQQAVLGYNCRLLPGEGPEVAVQHLRRAARLARATADVRLADGTTTWSGSKVTPADGRHFQLLRQAILETWQVEGQPAPAVVPYLVMGATDSKHYAPLSLGGVLRFVPYAMNQSAGDLGLLHATDERIRVSSYSRAVCSYVRMMQLLAGPGQPEQDQQQQ